MGLLTVLVGGALLAGMALSLALMGAGESTLAMHDRDARSAAYAARGAASLAIAELRQRGDWSTMLTAGGDPSVSAAPSRLMDVSLTPSAPWGGTLDLRTLTAAVQADTDGAPGPGDAIVWRLFLASPLDRVLSSASDNRVYLVAWVADDKTDGDGNPSADINNVVLVHAEALGPGGLRAIVDVTLAHAIGGGVPDVTRVLTLRSGPD